MTTASPINPQTLAAAVEYAATAHETQFRKRATDDSRTKIPYISHLLGVASIVIEDGGTLDGTIAGLLHDVIEDQDDDLTRAADIEHRFGAAVLTIVQKCSGPKQEEPGMADFRLRKQVYLDHLRGEDNIGAIMVSLADKVHNARSTVNDLETDGPRVWDRFNAGAPEQLWWYGSLASAYADHAHAGRADPARAAELGRLVARMRELTPA